MYRLNKAKNILEELEETTFSENNIKERQNIEEWLRKNPEVMGEDLLIIGHEYDKFEVNERLDLLAIDKEGNIVVIEVKRDVTGGNVDFQALKYASYCSRLNPNDILEIFTDYINRHGLELKAVDELMTFLNVEDEETLNTVLNSGQRIIIIGKDIDKRILSVCTWLYENNINIKCITIKPYKYNDELIVDLNQIIPPYKLEDYYINKKAVTTGNKINLDTEIVELLQAVATGINTKTNYRVTYAGKRSYFIGGKFLSKPLNFVIAYSRKDNFGVVSIESYKEEGTNLLKKIYEEKREYFEEQLQCSLVLEEGARNKSLYRLMVRINMKTDKALVDYANVFVDVFVKYKRLLESAINDIKLI
jgi:hypothetical protein